MNTAFYRDLSNNIRIVTDNLTQAELRGELNGNGFKVIKVMKGEKTLSDFEKIENEKKYR